MIVNTTLNDFQYFTSEQLNAPQMMGNSNGDMLNVIDACLLHGWGEQTATESVLADGLLTITFGLSHGFLQNQLVTITGLTDGTLNGKKRITTLTPNSITIKADNALSADGTAKVKLAPLDWQSLFGTTDPLKRAYRSKATGVQRVLFLDMSYPNPADYHSTAPAKRAMVTVCEDMQVLGVPIGDMTKGINNKPTNANGSLFWYQKRGGGVSPAVTTAVPSTVSKWRLIGNGEVFYLIVGWSGHNSADSEYVFDAFGFGKFSDLTDGAENNTFLSAVLNINDKESSVNYPGLLGSGASSPVYSFDDSNMALLSEKSVFKSATIGSGTQVPYPNKYGNAIFATPNRVYVDKEIIGFFYNFMYLDSAVDAQTYNSRVLEDLLIVPLQLNQSQSPTFARSVAFYVGG